MKRAQPLSRNDGQRPDDSAANDGRRDIETLNLTWLLAARAAAQSDPDTAGVVFGLDQALCERLCAASVADLQALARSRLVLFRPRFADPLLAAGSADGDRCSLGLALQSILLAAEEACAR